jgi:hypothetical protein
MLRLGHAPPPYVWGAITIIKVLSNYQNIINAITDGEVYQKGERGKITFKNLNKKTPLMDRVYN